MTSAASIGEQLRAARVERQLTVGDVASRTNVSAHMIEAIERDQLARLPGGIIARGHLRAFADAVGADREAIVAEYVRRYPELSDPMPPAIESTPQRPAWWGGLGWAACAALLVASLWWFFALYGATAGEPREVETPRPADIHRTSRASVSVAAPGGRISPARVRAKRVLAI